jgi:hypothetical protein
MRVLAVVGTRKGLFPVAGNDPRRGWHVDGAQREGSDAFRIDVTASGG